MQKSHPWRIVSSNCDRHPMKEIAFFLKPLSLAFFRRPLPIGLLLCSLSIVGFYSYQSVAVEFYYSWPYATMEASALVSYNLENSSNENHNLTPEEANGNVFVENYRILIEHNGNMKELTLHGVSDFSSKMLDATVFNTQALGNAPIDPNGVWIDEKTARDLGIKPSEEIRLIQRLSETETQVKVTAIVASYAPTQGVVASNNLAAGMIPYSFDIYASSKESLSALTEKAESINAIASLQVKEDACQMARLAARELLPFMQSDAFQVAALFLSSGVFFIFAAMTVRHQTDQFFLPLMTMGLLPRKAIELATAELGIIAIAANSFAGFAAIAGLKLAYGFPPSVTLFLATTALLLIGAFIGSFGAIFTLWINLRRKR